MTYKPVTCIGSRKLPHRMRPRLAVVARKLESLGYTLRSGAAAGSDAAFEVGLTHPDRAEIYLPCPGFNGHPSKRYNVTPEALALAEEYHPAWHRCSDFAKLLHARNCYQVLGEDLRSPSLFVVCWTPGAMDVGGTSQALRIARRLSIPMYNIADEHALAVLCEKLRGEDA